MRILVLSFYFPPDLAAGSFRTSALVDQLQSMLPKGATVDVIAACPNRYKSFRREVRLTEQLGNVSVKRIPVPVHQSGLIDQSRTFLAYARGVRDHVRGVHYDLIYATSSRLMTAFLGANLSRRGAVPLYLDIRDIFVDTVKDVFRGRHAAALLPALSLIERYTIRSAKRMNIVSPGFEAYFRSRYPEAQLDFFTNGVDDEFVDVDWGNTRASAGRIRVLYAGNIGQGQGLHAIVPGLAAATADTHEYIVVGDGGARHLLEDALLQSGSANVRIEPPVGREPLIELYRNADVLFLHLNDLAAFEKVLPSKAFEYAATGKPVLAGVAGYAKSFIEREVPNACVFAPCDATAGIHALRSLSLGLTDRSKFVEKYRRTKIMRSLASSVLQTAGIDASGTTTARVANGR